jgi:hypothetical protein
MHILKGQIPHTIPKQSGAANSDSSNVMNKNAKAIYKL